MSQVPEVKPIELSGVKLDINYFLTCDYDDISVARDELPAIIEWLNEQLQGLHESRLIAKAELAEAEAKVYFELTGTGDDNFEANYPGSKRTETAVGHAIAIDPSVKRLKRDLAVLTAWTSRLAGSMRSLQSRLDLLRSSEATRREVFSDQPVSGGDSE